MFSLRTARHMNVSVYFNGIRRLSTFNYSLRPTVHTECIDLCSWTRANKIKQSKTRTNRSIVDIFHRSIIIEQAEQPDQMNRQASIEFDSLEIDTSCLCFVCPLSIVQQILSSIDVIFSLSYVNIDELFIF
jgi:hypothetical protein